MNFADYPVSITEKRADDEDNGRLLTPRDAVISVLRQIDSGEMTPDGIVIVMTSPDNGDPYCNPCYISAKLPKTAMVGALMRVITIAD